ncbi:hypothetical protein BKN38_02160 [Helicobacter sp. CLO-3]|uniref:DUF4200 domain-containing protein n=1 Tax=unclassified Helicobacter TaxID=2593540 RepID=UPI000804C484|nr:MULTISPECIES: DUF4200 domain-containing protein [unclassified Helicobacter]OBV29683.1 hypothetical protein BA723_04420 [Helicobacter sp. CLO-3]OHU84866.1 hypothetical protein BKN38_02160 [Helicobacter sp. CLO-3]
MNQGLYLESINQMTKEFLAQKNFEDFLAQSKVAIGALLAHNDAEKDTIRKAVVDFLAQRGMRAVVMFRADSVEIKTSITNPEKNAYVDFLIRYLSEKRDTKTLQNSEKSAECIKDAFAYMQNSAIKDESLVRDIVRSAMKKILGLNERDGLFFNNLEPYIKNFDFDLVENNAKIRELKKPSNIESLLDSATKDKITNALKDANLSALARQVTQDIIAQRLSALAPIDFLSNFSFGFIQNLAKCIESVLAGGASEGGAFAGGAPENSGKKSEAESKSTESKNVDSKNADSKSAESKNIDSSASAQFSPTIINYYCIEYYRSSKGAIYGILAQGILDLLGDSALANATNMTANAAAKRFVSFFDGQNRSVNGKSVHILLIQDVDSKVWSLNDIEYILRSETSVNTAIQAQKQKIATTQDTLQKIEQTLQQNDKAIAEKLSQIDMLTQEYDAKKAKSLEQQNTDVETRNAMTKIINGILQQKIQTLDAISSLKTQSAQLKESIHKLYDDQKKAQAEINLITRENKESIRRFENLARAFSFCIGEVIEDLDNNV